MGFSPAQARSVLLPRGTNRKAQLEGEGGLPPGWSQEGFGDPLSRRLPSHQT